jgi:hypothetical protein
VQIRAEHNIFLILNKIENDLWSIMAQDRCSALVVLSIEIEITTLLDFKKNQQ